MSGRIPRILVVDDEEAIRRMLDLILRSKGYLVEFACDGRKGVESAVKNPPDAVLLDLLMPGANGYEAIRALRAAPGTREVPIIVLSAKTYPRDKEQALSMGANDFLEKPIDRDALAAALERHMGGER